MLKLPLNLVQRLILNVHNISDIKPQKSQYSNSILGTFISNYETDKNYLMLIDMVNLTPLNCSYQSNSLLNLGIQIDIFDFNSYNIHLNELFPYMVSISDFISYPPDEQLNNWDKNLIGIYKNYMFYLFELYKVTSSIQHVIDNFCEDILSNKEAKELNKILNKKMDKIKGLENNYLIEFMKEI